VSFTGLAATVNILHHEPANDVFTLSPLGGLDFVTINDLTGLTGTRLNVNLAASAGGNTGDGLTDQITINADTANNTITVIDTLNSTQVNGLTTILSVFSADPTLDTLRINALAGADTITVDQAGGVGTVRRVLVDGGENTDAIVVSNTDANGTASILPSIGNDSVSVNTDGLFLANAIFPETQRIGSLNIGPNGRATLPVGVLKVLTTASLTITGTGRLDLTRNALIYDYPVFSPIAGVRTLLRSGYSNGTWTGPGILTSVGSASGNGIGYGEASLVAPGGTFLTQPVDGTAVVMRFTRFGDANLDTDVDLDDIGPWSTNFTGELGVGTGTKVWTQGDWDYQGDVDLDDVGKWSLNFTGELGGGTGQTVAAPPVRRVQSRSTSISRALFSSQESVLS
jgi:hypothetical protein